MLPPFLPGKHVTFPAMPGPIRQTKKKAGDFLQAVAAQRHNNSAILLGLFSRFFVLSGFKWCNVNIGLMNPPQGQMDLGRG